MMCMDFHRHYDIFISTDDFLKEIVDSQLKVFYTALFLSFLSVHFHFSCTHFLTASINNAECLLS
jgi:hypothetical protein